MDKKSVLVIGDVMIDHYLWGETNKISPEAPVPVVDIQKESKMLGGAGNVVNNLRAFDLDVMIMSVIGDDDTALELISMVENIGADRYFILDESRSTTKKTRLIASHQQMIRYDNETSHPINYQCEKTLVYKIMETIDRYDIVILSDYAKGVLTDSLVQKIIFASLGANIKVLVDPKGSNFSKYRGAYLLTPNKKEAILATKHNITDNDSLTHALKKLLDIADVKIPLVTLGEDGIAILQGEKLFTSPTVAKEVFDVTGAGDTVISALAYGILSDFTIEETLQFANTAAGVVVAKLGSATATLDEIESYRLENESFCTQERIKNYYQIGQIIKNLKQNNKKIVFTNGCFDILHAGHISYLEKAKQLGDVLIVGLNSDNSIKRLKGENRPINNQNDRAHLLAALRFVDYVIIFDEDTPYELICKIQPDTLVKGGDYKTKKIVGSDIVKNIQLIDFVKNKSTTNIINTIKGITC